MVARPGMTGARTITKLIEPPGSRQDHAVETVVLERLS
jgi:hypothetical protein